MDKKLDPWDLGEFIYRAKFQGFKTPYTEQQLEWDVPEKELVKIYSAASEFLKQKEAADKKENDANADALAPGFYLFLNGRVIAGPFENQEKALEVRVSMAIEKTGGSVYIPASNDGFRTETWPKISRRALSLVNDIKVHEILKPRDGFKQCTAGIGAYCNSCGTIIFVGADCFKSTDQLLCKKCYAQLA